MVERAGASCVDGWWQFLPFRCVIRMPQPRTFRFSARHTQHFPPESTDRRDMAWHSSWSATSQKAALGRTNPQTV